MADKKKLVVLTGSGISAESGIPTFRDCGTGLWENYDINSICTANAMKVNAENVHKFYNMLRERYKNAKPNHAHDVLVKLQDNYDVHIITQNVDNLHEQAGSKNVLHLHGEIMKCRDINDPTIIYDIPENAEGKYDTYDEMQIDGHEIRPHIVFFGEDVPNIKIAQEIIKTCDICIIIGTSMVVYPAAGLVDYVPYGNEIYYIDPNPTIDYNTYSDIQLIPETATKGMDIIYEKFKLKNFHN